MKIILCLEYRFGLTFTFPIEEGIKVERKIQYVQALPTIHFWLWHCLSDYFGSPRKTVVDDVGVLNRLWWVRGEYHGLDEESRVGDRKSEFDFKKQDVVVGGMRRRERQKPNATDISCFALCPGLALTRPMRRLQKTSKKTFYCRLKHFVNSAWMHLNCDASDMLQF